MLTPAICYDPKTWGYFFWSVRAFITNTDVPQVTCYIRYMSFVSFLFFFVCAYVGEFRPTSKIKLRCGVGTELRCKSRTSYIIIMLESNADGVNGNSVLEVWYRQDSSQLKYISNNPRRIKIGRFLKVYNYGPIS